MPKEDAYSSGHLVLSHFGTWMCYNVETNLSWTCLVSGPLNFEHPSVLLFCSDVITIIFTIKSHSHYMSNDETVKQFNSFFHIVQLYTISYSTTRFIYVAVQSWLKMNLYSLRVIWRCETTKPMSGDGMQIKFSYMTISQVRITLSPKRPGTPVSSWYGIQAREGVSLYVRIWNQWQHNNFWTFCCGIDLYKKFTLIE